MFSDIYKIPGNYYCNSDTKAKTIKNCPFTRAFVLKVTFANGDGYPQQTFINYSTNEVYRRTWDSYKSTWTGEVNYVTNSDLQSGIVTIPNVPIGENDFTFSYPNVFSSPPKAVIATIQQRGYARYLSIQTLVKNTSSFVIRLENISTEIITNVAIYWMAK